MLGTKDFLDLPGPLEGHPTRSQGSPRKTRKQTKVECTEEEIRCYWMTFRKSIDDLNSQNHDQQAINMLLQPSLNQVKLILLEEDKIQLREHGIGSFGECMEYAFNENIFIECAALAQNNEPPGIFNLCVNFIIDLALNVRGMPIIHNDKVHRALIQLARCIHSFIDQNIFLVNDTKESPAEYSNTVLRYMQMITELSVNRNPDISKFFIEEKRFGKERGPMTYVPIKIILDYLKQETPDQNRSLKGALR